VSTSLVNTANAANNAWQPAPNRYDAQSLRYCGRSGLQLPAISLGLWHNFGGVDDAAAAHALLRHAFDSGITHIDLANNYGPPPGSAETLFGEWLRRDMPGELRDELVISTKAGYRMGLLERTPEQGLLQTLVDEGVGCIPFSPLAQGLLSDRYLDGAIPADSRAAQPHSFLKPAAITPQLLQRLRGLAAVAEARGQPLAGMAVRWLLQRPAVCSVLIGASRPAQIDAAWAAVRAPALSDDELRALDALCA
jgi:aryl-alcohol dehydrogenase-like predicted oxidoreductase